MSHTDRLLSQLVVVVFAVRVEVRRTHFDTAWIRMGSNYAHSSQHYATPIPELKPHLLRVPTWTANVQQEELITIIRLHLVVVVGAVAKINNEIMAVDLPRTEEVVSLPLLKHAAPTDSSARSNPPPSGGAHRNERHKPRAGAS